MDIPILLAQAASPLTWLAAAVFAIPAIYVIISALRDQAWMQLGGGVAFLGVVIALAFHRLAGGLLILGGIALFIVRFIIAKGDREEFQLD